MPIKKRHKFMLVAIGLYWPAIFIATHIPIPTNVIQNAGMSDKTLHFLAYLALVSIAWFAVSPFDKVNWKKAKVWIILAAIAWYGAFDEWLQQFVGRQPDIYDFYADIAAAFTALLIMTFLTFWPAILALSSIFIFSITCLTDTNIVFRNELMNSAFYFLSYAFFTLMWILSSERIWDIKKSQTKWVISSVGVPIAALAVMTLLAAAMQKNIWYMNIITALTAIIATALATFLTSKSFGEKSNLADCS